MSSEFKKQLLNKLRVFNRVICIVFALAFILARIALLTKNNIITAYYIAVPVLILGLDELLFFRRVKRITSEDDGFPYTLFRIRTCIYIVLLSAGGVISVIPPALIVCIYLCILYVIIQDTLFCDIFNLLGSYITIIASLLISGGLVFAYYYIKSYNTVKLIAYVPPIVLGIIVCVVLHMVFANMVKNLSDKYAKLLYDCEDIKEENSKLIEFREKVEKVNNEINYQKINLTKANNDLAESNLETRSLIDVMKYFSSSYDIEKNAEVMINNIMKVKNAGSVGIYLSAGVYMNEDPFVDVKSVNNSSEDLLRKDIAEIFETVLKLESVEPLVICKNGEFKYDYLTGGNICNAVAFPAYENKHIYGVMVVTSTKFDFFQNGYTFYESSVMDYTSALISDRLYLKTEDMAKKDGLTKIYNRTYFNQFYQDLKEDIHETGDTLTVAMMDIDHFKNVNDTYGHLAGDEVIKMVASIDDKYANKYQGTAVRFGGEEFLLILRNINVDEASDILKEMHEEIASTIVTFEGMEIHVNASIGVASYRETCDDINELVDRADQAMYYSKTHGRGLIVIDGREEEASA